MLVVVVLVLVSLAVNVSGVTYKLMDQVELYTRLESCLLNNFGVSMYDRDYALVRKNYSKPLGQINLAESTSLAVRIDNILDGYDINMLDRLHTCVVIVEKERYIRRMFHGPAGEDVEGNIVLYLTGILAELAPGLMERVKATSDIATEMMGWNDLRTPRNWTEHKPSQLGVRCAEIISYYGKENSGLAGHKDVGSVYTLIVLLVDPDDYEGGRLMVGKSGDFFSPPQGGGVLFQSEALHGLTRVSSGHRRVFSLEFWDQPTAAFGEVRPGP